jgi:hypothetical protein
MPSKHNAKRAPEVEPDEHHWIDRRSAAIGTAHGHPRADEAEVQDCVEVTIEVVWRDEPFEGDDHRPVEIADFGQSKHGCPSARMANRVAYPNLRQSMFFTGPGCL